MTAEKRCDWSDLLVENCGHCNGVPDIWEGPGAIEAMPEQVEGTWTVATYDSSCGCGCNGRISQGDEIVLAKIDDVQEWVLIDHARPLGYAS